MENPEHDNASSDVSLNKYKNKYNQVSEVLTSPAVPWQWKVIIVLMTLYTPGTVAMANGSAAWWAHLMLALPFVVLVGILLKRRKSAKNKEQSKAKS